MSYQGALPPPPPPSRLLLRRRPLLHLDGQQQECLITGHQSNDSCGSKEREGVARITEQQRGSIQSVAVGDDVSVLTLILRSK